ncbi:MAG: Rrf2 family transcriptional regulator [Deltaproteobacteria bacterium]|nr:Rrf2 family transcriptional regulator [Deltaproteobacteria bacterium]
MLTLTLSQTNEYALRAMSYLAHAGGKIPLTATKISRETKIPQHYLSKIMKLMVNAKLVHSQKGHRGGFVLAKPRTKIRFFDIIVATGYNPNPNRCVFGWATCNPKLPCMLHHAWSELNTTFKTWALEKTLNDIYPENKTARQVKS